MKVEPSFRDVKGGDAEEAADRVAVGLLVGETVRAELHEAYSGLFILLKHRLKLRLIRLALDRFRAIVKGPVLSPI